MQNFTNITREQVVEHNLVDRYLMGQLTEEQSMAFENFYAGCPDTMEELDLSERLIAGMRQGGQEFTATDNIAAFHTQPKKPGVIAGLLSSPLYSAAATFVAVACLGMLSLGAGSGTDSPLGVGNVPLAYLEATRGAETGFEVAVDGSSEVILNLDLGIAADESYVARVLNANGDLIWTFNDLRVNEEDGLRIILRGDAVVDGRYRVNVRNSSGETWVFPYTLIGASE